VRVTGDDHARIADRAGELVVFDGNRAYTRMEDDHCSALRVRPGSGELFCGAYLVRPQACRDLERGQQACEGEVTSKWERPLLAPQRRRAGA